VLALDRFIELHPGSEDVDYAYYLKALCFYEQITDVARDQAMTTEALNALDTLVRRFPDSKYTRDATLKRDLTLDHLAGKEMEIGRYYLNRKQVNAAIGRFTSVVRDYQTTTHVPEALYRLVEAYMTLGLHDQAVRVAAVLGYNYPGNKWYQDAYDILDDEQRQKLINGQSWVDRTVDSLFKPE
jgi:outer membrane protein assembly factor BamD